MDESPPRQHLNLLDLFTRGEHARKLNQRMIAESRELRVKRCALRAEAAFYGSRIRDLTVQLAGLRVPGR